MLAVLRAQRRRGAAQAEPELRTIAGGGGLGGEARHHRAQVGAEVELDEPREVVLPGRFHPEPHL